MNETAVMRDPTRLRGELVTTLAISAFLVFLASSVVIDYMRKHDAMAIQAKTVKIQENAAQKQIEAAESTKDQAFDIEQRLVSMEAKLDTLIQLLPQPAAKSK